MITVQLDPNTSLVFASYHPLVSLAEFNRVLKGGKEAEKPLHIDALWAFSENKGGWILSTLSADLFPATMPCLCGFCTPTSGIQLSSPCVRVSMG